MSLERAWPTVRDILAFGVGAFAVVAELGHTPRDPLVLAFGASLMGIPAALGIGKKPAKS